MITPTPENILAARKAANLSQADAARLVGLSSNYWATCERGLRNMGESVFELFLIKTDQHPDYKKKSQN